MGRFARDQSFTVKHMNNDQLTRQLQSGTPDCPPAPPLAPSRPELGPGPPPRLPERVQCGVVEGSERLRLRLPARHGPLLHPPRLHQTQQDLRPVGPLLGSGAPRVRVPLEAVPEQDDVVQQAQRLVVSQEGLVQQVLRIGG